MALEIAAASATDGHSRGYDEALAMFDPMQAEAFLAMDAAGHVNAAEICCDRHAVDPNRVALRHRSATGETRDWTFAELQRRSTQFAQVLVKLGVGKGDRVAGLLPRRPELLITILATWRIGAVYQPLFTAFGPKAIEHRINAGATRVVVTDAANHARLPASMVATLVTVFPVADMGHDFWTLLEAQEPTLPPAACARDDPFLLMFTSGTTGLPKSLVVPIRAVAAFVGYLRDAVDLRAGDRFWNLADPGWAYGLYYAVTGPLALGMTTVFHEGGFSAASTYETILEYRITNLAGSPTAYRMLMTEVPEFARRIKGQLRAVSSAGEPLNPEIIRWFDNHLGARIHDHYGQTELGMVLCNHHALRHSVHPGSAGYPLPGHRVVVVSPEGEELGVGQPGTLALDRRYSPMRWFAGYQNQGTAAFQGSYYLSGDTVERNDDGSEGPNRRRPTGSLSARKLRDAHKGDGYCTSEPETKRRQEPRACPMPQDVSQSAIHCRPSSPGQEPILS